MEKYFKAKPLIFSAERKFFEYVLLIFSLVCFFALYYEFISLFKIKNVFAIFLSLAFSSVYFLILRQVIKKFFNAGRLNIVYWVTVFSYTLLLSSFLSLMVISFNWDNSNQVSFKIFFETLNKSINCFYGFLLSSFFIEFVLLLPLLTYTFEQWIGIKQKFKKFLWKLLGLEIQIVENCKIEHKKFNNLGLLLLFFCIMVFIVGSYFFALILNSSFISIPVTLALTSLIFVVLRLILIFSFHNELNLKIFNHSLYVLFSVGFIILISLFYSNMLQTLLFWNKINEQKIAYSFNQLNKISENTYLKNVNDLKHIISDLERKREFNLVVLEKDSLSDLKIYLLKSEIENRLSLLRSLPYKTSDSLTLVNERKRLKNEIQQMESRITEIKDSLRMKIIEEIKHIDNQIIAYKNQLDFFERSYHDAQNEIISLLKIKPDFFFNLSALNKLKNENFFASMMGAFITLFFMSILGIIFYVSLLKDKSPYFEKIKTVKHYIYVGEALKISEINAEANNRIELSLSKHKLKLEEEMRANQELLNVVKQAQLEIAKKAIEEWKKQELEKAAQNPLQYLRKG